MSDTPESVPATDNQQKAAKVPSLATPVVKLSAVAIPPTLSAEAKNLAKIASAITDKDIESAAATLGVFEGAMNLDKFKTYANDRKRAKKRSAEADSGFGLGSIFSILKRHQAILNRLSALTKLLPAESTTADSANSDAPLMAEQETMPEDASVEDIVAGLEQNADQMEAVANTVDPAQLAAAQAQQEAMQNAPTELAPAAPVQASAPAESQPEPGDPTQLSESDEMQANALEGGSELPTGALSFDETEAELEEAPEKLSWFARRRQAKEAKKRARMEAKEIEREGREAEKAAKAAAKAGELPELEGQKMSWWQMRAWKKQQRKEAKLRAKEAKNAPAQAAAPAVDVLPDGSSVADEEAALRAEMAQEGYLEGNQPEQVQAAQAQPATAPGPTGAAELPTQDLSVQEVVAEGQFEVPAQPEVQQAPVMPAYQTAQQQLDNFSEEGLSKEEIKALKRQLKQQAKMEKDQAEMEAKMKKKQEEEWKKEADRRQKMLKERKEKAAKAASQEDAASVKAKMKLKAPKPKKQSGLQKFLTSLNYMGMEKDRVGFIDNLGTMMEAGLPLLDAVRSLERETKNKQMKKIISRVIVAIETGSPLWRAMDAQNFFRDQQVSMIRVGEEAGNLTENLHYLSEQERKDRELRGKVKTAMIYPAIILTMLTLIILGLGMFVLPNLIQVIFSLGVPLPFITRMIVKFTNLFTEQGAVVIPSFFGGVVLFILLTKYTNFKVVVQFMLYKLPGIGPLMREATLSRFGVIMGGLLRAGVPVTEALESLAKVTPLVRYRKFYYQLLERVRLGDSFATSFKKIKLTDKCFPPSLQQLVITGEQSGSLTKIMLKSADIHDKRASEIAEKLPVILEPMLLLFIGSLVGMIALGILAPIYSVVGNVGG